MTPKFQRLLAKLFLPRLVVLAGVNVIFGFLAVSNIPNYARISVVVILCVLDFGSLIYFSIQYRKVLRVLQLKPEPAFVKLANHVAAVDQTPMAWQTAKIGLGTNDLRDIEKPDLEVEIAMSSVPSTEMPVFKALLYFEDKKPSVIVNEELGALLTVSVITNDRRA